MDKRKAKAVIRAKQKIAAGIQASPLETLVKCHRYRKERQEDLKALEASLIPPEAKAELDLARETLKVAKALEDAARQALLEEKLEQGDLRPIAVVNKRGRHLCRVIFRQSAAVRVTDRKKILRAAANGTVPEDWVEVKKNAISRFCNNGIPKAVEGAVAMERAVTAAILATDEEGYVLKGGTHAKPKHQAEESHHENEEDSGTADQAPTDPAVLMDTA